MTPAEREREARFLFERDRTMYRATRALVRTVLSQYRDVAPADWRFETQEHGRPFVASPRLDEPLQFNLSNTRGLVVCAVSESLVEMGVDVERNDRVESAMQIAERFFSPSEVRTLMALPPEERAERFATIWTLKESYIKARGLG